MMKNSKKKVFLLLLILILGLILLITAFSTIVNDTPDNNKQTENNFTDKSDTTVDELSPTETDGSDNSITDNDTPIVEPENNEEKETEEGTDNTASEDTVSVPEEDTSDEVSEETPTTVETITLDGTIIWDDNDNQDGKRPETITVSLFADGEVSKTQDISSETQWKWSFPDLIKSNEYTVKATEEIIGYTQKTDGDNIVFTHMPSKISVFGSVEWADNNNQDGKRPSDMTIELSANGIVTATEEISDKNGWEWIFTELDEFQNGKKITYTVSTQSIDGYKTEITGYNITNTHIPETVSLSGSIIWDDDSDKDGKRPHDIEINIISDEKILMQKTVSEENDWSWSASNIPKYRDGGTVIKYSISTKNIENYTTEIDGFNITNTVNHVPESTTDPIENTSTNTESNKPENESEPSADINQEMENIIANHKPATITVLKPVASGTLTKQNENALIDYSNSKDGYVMIKYLEQTNVKLKAQVIGPTTTYTYNLTSNEWAVLPFSDGNGEYGIKIMKNVVDNKYSNVLTLKHTVTLEDEHAPFLRPNQYVNYENAENTVTKAAELLNDQMSVLTKVKIIYNYIVSNITYDYEKSYTVQSGYLPDLDKVLEEKKGICFDYAALMTGMLRSQNIPCKLVIGYADEAYHAWISVWSPETGWIDNAIFFNGTNWQLMDPTFAAGGVQDFKNITYTSKYIY